MAIEGVLGSATFCCENPTRHLHVSAVVVNTFPNTRPACMVFVAYTTNPNNPILNMVTSSRGTMCLSMFKVFAKYLQILGLVPINKP